jgi:hypothetical protein
LGIEEEKSLSEGKSVIVWRRRLRVVLWQSLD